MDLSQLQGVSVSGIFVILMIAAITKLVQVVRQRDGGPVQLDARAVGDKAVMAERVRRIEASCERLAEHAQQQSTNVDRLAESVRDLARITRRMADRLPQTPAFGVGVGVNCEDDE
jgi:methyl-accepting chemotaxis protein